MHCRIGNLLPLAKSVNEHISNATFTDKLIQYQHSNFISVKKFLHYYGKNTEWTEKDIDNRSTHMAELAYKHIWSTQGIFKF